ncbi:MMS19 nucleotide excision repair protein homolog isoform X2 [Linepithema humile]|uniref:MMS19 nucleotide excision repair protein homolog isoform X2 n=1 Tax=Linepithema humile TaxID=83485 RepID=UPI00351E48FF
MTLSPNFDLKKELDISLQDTTALNSLCGNIASEIESGSMKLCTFVETLSSYMTNQNIVMRENGVIALSYVLSQLSQDYLTESELYFITIFYCDRIKDHYNIIPSVLNGILAISSTEDVTREDLAKKLAPCLCAVPDFADYCIPLIIEKSYSSLRVAKLDSLNLLCESVQTFGLLKVKPYLLELWTTLKKEIMPERDIEIRDAALEALTSLVKVISVDKVASKDFIDKIIIDIKSSLCDVQFSLYRPAQKILEMIAIISKPMCVQILQVIIPLCIGQYSTKSSVNDKIILIETLNNFMKICTNYDFCIQDVPELAWVNIPQIYLDGLTAEDIELKSKIFLGLTIQKKYLNDVQRSICYNAICNEIETGCHEMQIICHTTIIDFTALYLEEILLVTERLSLNIDETEMKLLKRRIQALSAIAKIREIGYTILPKIVALLTNDICTDICITALLNIQKLITLKKFDFNIHEFLYNECHIIDKLIAYKTNVLNHKLLISNVCQLIIRNLTIKEQYMIAAKYATILNTKMLETDVNLLMNLLIPLKKDINLNISYNAVENLYNLAVSNCNLDVRQTACIFLSVLLNKMEIIDLDTIVPYLEDKIDDNLKANIDIESKQQVVNFQIWMTKALVMRGHEQSRYFLKNLTYLLSHNELGRHVSEQYQILVNKHEDILIVENFCNVKIFYKQRVFEHLLQQNVNFTNSMRQNYLIVVVHLLEHIPEELLFLYLTELVPLLIESLSLNDEHLVTWTLISLKLLLDTKHDVFSDNAQCVIPRLLQLSTFRSMKVRIAALECLANYANYPTILINPYKQLVLDKLGTIIDDRKRLVRKAAVQARIRWFLMSSSDRSQE